MHPKKHPRDYGDIVKKIKQEMQIMRVVSAIATYGVGSSSGDSDSQSQQPSNVPLSPETTVSGKCPPLEDRISVPQKAGVTSQMARQQEGGEQIPKLQQHQQEHAEELLSLSQTHDLLGRECCARDEKIMNLEQENDSLQLECSRSAERLSAVDEKIRNLEQENNLLQQEIDSFRRECNRSAERLSAADEKIRKLEQENHSLRARQRTDQGWQEKCDSLENDNAKLEDANAKLQGELSAAIVHTQRAADARRFAQEKKFPSIPGWDCFWGEVEGHRVLIVKPHTDSDGYIFHQNSEIVADDAGGVWVHGYQTDEDGNWVLDPNLERSRFHLWHFFKNKYADPNENFVLKRMDAKAVQIPYPDAKNVVEWYALTSLMKRDGLSALRSLELVHADCPELELVHSDRSEGDLKFGGFAEFRSDGRGGLYVHDNSLRCYYDFVKRNIYHISKDQKKKELSVFRVFDVDEQLKKEYETNVILLDFIYQIESRVQVVTQD